LVIGVDVGGTFTDVVSSSATAVWCAKAPTDPREFQRGVVEAFALRGLSCGRWTTARATQSRRARTRRDRPPSRGTRDVWLEGEHAVKDPVYDAEALRFDDKLAGLALIDAKDTTIQAPAQAESSGHGSRDSRRAHQQFRGS
jgi:N-methylhydantoinase A/oxoprolinase/acetone carboxylase beta subunit